MDVPRKKGGIEGCQVPLLADFTKKISTEYGVLNEAVGAAVRGTFLIDPAGVVQSIQVNNFPIGRNVDEVIRLIDAYQANQAGGVVCPIGWSKGKEAITPSKAGEWFEKHGK